MKIFLNNFKIFVKNKKKVTQYICFLIGSVCLVFMNIVPVPYGIEAPGPTFNTLSKLDGKTDTVLISGVKTNQKLKNSKGELRFVTVSVYGADKDLRSLFVLESWFNPNYRVLPDFALFDSGLTPTQQNKKFKKQMTDSQDSAIVSAINFVIENPNFLPNNSPIKKVIDNYFKKINKLKKELTKSQQKELYKKIETVLKVEFSTGAVGGPSAGTMLSLTILDKIGKENLVGENIVAGTGTIDNTGNVGPIGGIRQKIISSKRDGAKWFLTPKSNCSELKNHIPQGITAINISTLSQALNALKMIRENQKFPDSQKCF